MKSRILVLAIFLSILTSSWSQAECIDFTQYDNAFLNDVTTDHATYPAGSEFIKEGDISLIKPNEVTPYQFIDTIQNGMCFIGQLGIDLSSSPFSCKKLTFEQVAGGGLVVDSDTLLSPWMPFLSGDTTIYRPGFTVTLKDITGKMHYCIEGDFDYIEVSTSTICIYNICLQSCETSSCIDFTQYTSLFLDDVTTDHITYPVDSAFITSGDLSVIKPDELTTYFYIDTAKNGMCFIGAIGLDITSAQYSCRKLSWQQLAGGGLVIDGDTLLSPWMPFLSGDTTINRPGYSATLVDVGGEMSYTIEGDFDYVEISTSTICIYNVCLTECAASSCIDFTQYDNIYLDEVTMDHVTYPAGSAFITEGNISLIKPDEATFYQFIDTTNNGMCFIGQLGIDVSSAPYSCRKLTWSQVAGGGLVIDGDTLLSPWMPFIWGDTIINRPGYTATLVEVSGDMQYTIEGNFDYVEVSTSTICVSNICLSPCTTPACIDFTSYDNAYLDDVTMDHITYPAGAAFITEGGLSLIKPNEATFYQFIDTVQNGMCFIGHLGMDVSNSNASCNQLTFEQVAGGGLVVDGDTLTSPWMPFLSGDTIIYRSDYTVYINEIAGTMHYSIEGEFDYVEVSTSTICIYNICLSSCDSSGTLNVIETEPIERASKVYPNPTNGFFNLSVYPYEGGSVQIYNLNGQMVLSESLNSNTVEFDLSNLENGMYLIAVSFENEAPIFHKLIKN